MRAYWAVMSARFRMLLQYRMAAFAGLSTQIFWGFIRVMIFEAFYRSAKGPQPMTFAEVVTFIWLGQAMLRMLPWNVDTEIRAMIRSGSVAYELLRPLDLYTFWYSRAVALISAPTLIRATPMFVLALLFFGMDLPPSAASGFAWVAATICALFLSSAMITLMSISLMWTVAGEGLWRLMGAGAVILSGMSIPIPLFPDWAQPALNLMPFRGLSDAPLRLYLGHIPPDGAFAVILHQLVWTAFFIICGQWMLARGLRRLVVQGG